MGLVLAENDEQTGTVCLVQRHVGQKADLSR